MKRIIIFTTLIALQPIVNCVAYDKEWRLAAITGLLTNIFAFAVLAIVSTSFSTSYFEMIALFLSIQLISLLLFFRNSFNKAVLSTAIGGAITLGAAILFMRF